MTNKPERIYKFYVHFEAVFGPDREIGDVREVGIDIYAKSIDDAIATAWKTVTVSPEEFRIVAACEQNGRFAPWKTYYRDE